MANDYIPGRDTDCLAWMTNFSGLVDTNYLVYGLQSTDADQMDSLTSTFNDALMVATNGSTRTPMSVAAKDTALNNAVMTARRLVNIIQINDGVTNDMRAALRITIRKTNRTPTPAPTSSPTLVYIGSTPLQQSFKTRDQNSTDFRSKPLGVTALQVRIWVAPIGTTPSGPPTQQFDVTRNTFAANFQTGDIGKMATYIVNWKNTKAEIGPDSVPFQIAVS